MKIINLIKSEFIKNYTIKKLIFCILLLTLASLFIVYKTDNLLDNEDEYYDYNYNENIKISVESFKRSLIELESRANKTYNDELLIIYVENYIKYIELVKENITSNNDWKINIIVKELIPLFQQNYLIDILNKNLTNNEKSKICSEANAEVEQFFIDICNLTKDERNKRYQENNQLITIYEQLLKENKYYLYLKYKSDNDLLEKDDLEFVRILIDKKIESNNNYLAKNFIQYRYLKDNANMKIDTYEEYQETHKNNNSYQEYLSYNTNLKNKAIESRKILLYSTEHEIRQDIFYTYLDNVSESNMYTTPKLKVNRVLHLSVIVMLIVSITNSGIISKEHSNGTIKNIITAPVKRWKILLSKFMYLILDTYIIWLLGLIILSICAGIRFGFTELLTPKLIVHGSKVIEVNYYLYLIKNILIAGIPVMVFLSLLFFLSTITLNTSLTVGITSVISILSLFMWLLQFINNFKYIVYTPLWYLDSGYIFMNTEIYQISLNIISYNFKMGVISSIVVTIILLLITNIVYLKRDIKTIQ